MAGFYTGRSGSLKIRGKKVAKIRDWSLESTMELLSTNSIDSNFNTFTPGVKGATGSATLLLYRLQNENTATHTDAFNVLKDSGIMTTNRATEGDLLTFELNASNALADDIICNGYITSASMSVSTGELSTVSINFTVDGRFTQTF
tara:strand:+ start:8983 stop:9420 length:438 start_codon:yes stop_codon:yes gene_type:complete